MKVAIDLHIHSALSPCGDDDMTPNNIVNMAILNGLDAIAVTDHNSCDNVEAVMKVAEGRILVIPGMELQTREEVHLLSYFNDLSSLISFSNELLPFFDGLSNSPSFFGHQWIINELDEITGEMDQALLTSLSISLDDAVELIRRHKGIAVPAHVNKSSYSITSQLGFLPSYLNFRMLEYSQYHEMNFSDFPRCNFIFSSDAHSLGQILDRTMLISVDDLSIDGILEALSK
ncbi:MAG: PHP domain-containing protein [Clostridiales bacterium]|nr:PHP domain-containing protein [Clostridiales bacterium]